MLLGYDARKRAAFSGAANSRAAIKRWLAASQLSWVYTSQ